jgi:steroid 5-alpha reductase family enzyme
MAAIVAPFVTVLAAMLAVMMLSWLFQRKLVNAGWTDLFWTLGTGVSLVPVALLASPRIGWRSVLVALLVGAWAARLGGHIFLRVLGGAEDVRYAKARRDWGDAFQGRMLALSLIQAPVTAILAVSVALAASAPSASVRVADLAAVAVFLIALGGESLADLQLKRFKAHPENRGRVCDAGLWGFSRHPNYFFEGFIWLAWPMMAFSPHAPWTWAAFAAPATMFALVRFVSGVPPLEAAMLASKGDAYRRYQARVSAFIPLPPERSHP